MRLVRCRRSISTLIGALRVRAKVCLQNEFRQFCPMLSFDEMIETTKIHSIAGTLKHDGLIHNLTVPFASPHGNARGTRAEDFTGTYEYGEVSLANNGVLFLDELPEFSRTALEVLRQPIEDGSITISRAGRNAPISCSIMVVAAMNHVRADITVIRQNAPVPEQKIKRYLNRISGPLLDRFDIHVEVPAVKFEELRDASSAECSADIKGRQSKRNSAREDLGAVKQPATQKLTQSSLKRSA